nr:hypothetical protein [Micromonospora sp. DSM 115978]
MPRLLPLGEGSAAFHGIEIRNPVRGCRNLRPAAPKSPRYCRYSANGFVILHEELKVQRDNVRPVSARRSRMRFRTAAFAVGLAVLPVAA